MNAKGRRYLVLLLISVAIRIFFYFFQFEDTPFESIAKTHILYDVIFGAIVISLLESLKERKWLIGLAWAAFIASIAYSVLEWIQDAYSPFTQSEYARTIIIDSLVVVIFYICIFFARKSRARIIFRFLTAIFVLPYLFGLLAEILNLPSLDDWLTNRTVDNIVSILLNVLLAIAILRTPEFHKPQYADFME